MRWKNYSPICGVIMFFIECLFAHSSVVFAQIPPPPTSLIQEWEQKYYSSSEPDEKAKALSFWERLLTARIESDLEFCKARVIIPFEAAEGASVARCTLKPGPNNKIVIAEATGLYDQVPIGGIGVLGHGSIIRFSGCVGFPLEKSKMGMGMLDGFLTYSDSSTLQSLGLTNSTMLIQNMAEGAATFCGNPDDPLTFVMIYRIGLVHLHGTGTIIRADNEEVVIGKAYTGPL